MPWPESITVQFELVNELITEENEYYDPFNSQPLPYFQVAPQLKHIEGSMDFSVIFLITRRKFRSS